MKQTLFGKTAELFKASRRRKRLHRVIAGMSALVLVATSYTLILPGTTMESGGLVCGMEEHTHTDDCYESRLICTLEETAGHVHTDTCYPVEYVCGQEESTGHTHTDACYEAVSTLVCSQEESEGHTHGEGCYDAEGNLTCTLAEEAGHTHTDACYEMVSTLVCGQEESAGHTHIDDCLGARSGEPACGLEEGLAEADGHIHTDTCYEKVLVCQLPEHVHSAECYAQEEPEEEPETACTMEEHTHSETCYDGEGNLICTLPEHVHDESCYAVEIPEEDVPMDAFPEELPEGYTEYTFEDEESGLSVLVYAPDKAFGDRDVALFAQVLAEDSDAYAKAQANLDSAEDAPEYDGMAALDIRFVDAGAQDPAQAEEIEPDASLGQVFVKIDAKALLPGNVDESTLAVQHHREETASDDEAQEPGVVVEIVADSSETTGQVALTGSRETPEEEPAADAAEPLNNGTGAMDLETAFTVNGFSTFSVTWSTRAAVNKVAEYKSATTPGSTYYWGFYHQAKGTGYDTMYVLAMNETDAAAYAATMEQVDQFLEEAIAQGIEAMDPDRTDAPSKGTEVVVDGVSATVWKVRSGPEAHYLDSYTVPAGQTATKLILAPGFEDEVASGDRNNSNTYRDWQFSTEKPQGEAVSRAYTLYWHSHASGDGCQVPVYACLNTDTIKNAMADTQTFFHHLAANETVDIATQAPIYFSEDVELFHIDGYRLVDTKLAVNNRTIYPDVEWVRVYPERTGFHSPVGNWTSTTNTFSIMLVYEPVEEATGSLTIEDTISSDGCLRANFDASLWEGSGQAPDLDSGEYYYKWLRKGPGDTDFREVSGVISDSIEVYYDGARATYQVELWSVNDSSGPVAVSYEYLVPYYDQLQNGSFESPTVTVASIGNKAKYYTDFANGLCPSMVWKTTGLGSIAGKDKNGAILAGADMEIAVTSAGFSSSLSYSAYGVKTARDGSQFAELNACTPGALYQDVMTIPGEPLYWWLSHRARANGGNNASTRYDTLYVVIMAAEDAAQHAYSQDDIDRFLDAAKQQGVQQVTQGLTTPQNKGVEVTVDGVKATVWKVRSNGTQWYDYMDTYTVPEGQYLTRFFFASGGVDEVSYRNRGMGNLLDRVGFSQTYDPGDPDTGTVVVEKTVTGLPAGVTVPANSFEFTIKSIDGATVKTVKLPQQESKVPASGILAMNSAVTGLPAGNYEVTETQPGSLAGYSYESTSVQVNGGYKPGPLTTGAFALQNGKQVRVKFTNQYELSTGSLSLTKYVESNSESNYTTADSFTFRLTYDELEDGNAFDVTYSDSTPAGTLTARTDGGETYLELTLKQNQTATIEGLPAGAQVTISEVNHDGYAVKWQVAGQEMPGEQAAATIKAGETAAVVCTNTTGARLPNTGGPGIAQFMGLGTVLTLGAGLLLLRSRRRKGDDAC